MNDEQRFFERLREDARQLRYEPADEVFWPRLSARIRHRILAPQPNVAELLARWIRPVLATFSAVAIAGIVSFAIVNNDEESVSLSDTSAQITVAGDSYRVGD